MANKKDVEATPSEALPEEIKSYSKDLAKKNYKTLDEIFVGTAHSSLKNQLKEKGIAKLDEGMTLSASLDTEGKVLAMAAAVSRTPTESIMYLRDYVPDLKTTAAGGMSRRQKIKLYQQIAKREGIVNNAIKKKAALISQDGDFSVRAARQGKRPRGSVADDLLTLLTFWIENVNASPENNAITGSRGIKQVIRRGSRQAIIDGDLFLQEVWSKVKVPTLGGKAFSLPILLQTLPAADVEIAEGLIGQELFYWVPENINDILNPRDPNVKKLLDKTLPKELKSQLQKDRKALLDASLLIHIKHAGLESDSYGQSDVEACLTDIAYSRALKSLDFVTIDSLINRILVIKIGDENPDSEFHNLAIANARVNVFRQLVSEVGPNMLILWAGHDVSTVDVGAHNTLLDTEERHKLANMAIKTDTSVPDPLLTGSAEGGNAVAWAGFISLAGVVAELQEEWVQSLTQLGMRIAEENNFKDVDLIWEFSHKLLADREANAKIMLQAYQFGLISVSTLLEELGKDFNAELNNKIEEQEKDLLQYFVPLNLTNNPSGITGPDIEDQPGRPSRTEDPDKLGPDRDREDKTTDS